MRATFLKTAAIVAAFAPALAAAAEPPCLTPREFTALANYALPSVITGTANRCAATLPADAYLRRSSGALATRYAQSRTQAWPGAKQAFIKVSTATNPQAADLFRNMPDQNLQQMTDGLIEGLVGQRLPVTRCGAIDRLVALLAPLPADSTAELIAIAVGLGAKAGKANLGAFSICQA